MALTLRWRTTPHICVYGLTAAGKTTHAKLLAQQLDCDYVSASQLMFDELGYRDLGDNGTWLRSAAEISAKREDGSIDRAVNQRLLELAGGTRRIVFDSWTLPFIIRDRPNLKYSVTLLRLESDARSRAVKSIVSLGAGTSLSMSEAVRLISEKDSSSHQIFASTFGFDIFRPAEYFGPRDQLVVDIGAFVYGLQASEVRHGVSDAHQYIVRRLNEWAEDHE